MKISAIFASIAAGFILAAAPVRADVTLPHVFSDHMVLQQNMPVPVWGTAAAGEKVTVSFGDQKVSATADKDGKWMAKLANLKASAEGRELTVVGSNTVTFKDVLVGEVWLCSGQSNMDFTMAATPKYYFAGVRNEAQEVKAANYPQIRMFSGEWQRTPTPQSNIDGQWNICTPENAREFSAVGYYFAKYLHQALNVPVGIITETYGASTAESWIRREALAADPQLKPMLDRFDTQIATLTPEQLAASQQGEKAWRVVLDQASAQELAAWKANPDKPPFSGRSPARPAGTPATGPSMDQHNPTVMYNGMIAPIVPYAIQGVLWYQGESIAGGNPGRALYPRVQAALIKDWRALWGREDLPFYIVQLAALSNSGSNDPAVREAQATVLDIPHAGMANSIDIADPTNVHPKEKANVGYRLMSIALAKVYGRDLEYYGPLYQSMETKDGKIILKFTHTGGGLVAKGGSELNCFTIAGADGNFVPAKAVVEGTTVVVSSADVPQPVNVRYAWDRYPVPINFYNGAGFPAFAFRTDKN